MTTKEATSTATEQVHTSASKAAVQLNQPLLSQNAYKSIDTALRTIFPGAAEETKLQRARRILQEVAQDVSDEQLEVFVTSLQCLIDSWLDCYEKEVFDGLTLREVLHEG